MKTVCHEIQKSLAEIGQVIQRGESLSEDQRITLLLASLVNEAQSGEQ